MIYFDKEIMTKGKFTESFIIEGDNYGITETDDDGLPIGKCVSTKKRSRMLDNKWNKCRE